VKFKYPSEAKFAMMLGFYSEILLCLLMVVALVTYKYANAILVLCSLITNVFILWFYLVVSERLLYYLLKFLNQNPQIWDTVIEDRQHQEFMLQYEYPMSELGFVEKFRLRDMYAWYWYILEGSGRVLYFWYRPINTYEEAHQFQRQNTIIIVIYWITIPIAFLIEYILDEADAIDIGEFDTRIVTRGYIIILTICSSITLQSFSRSFNDILPFENFERRQYSMTVINTFYDLSSTLIRIMDFSFGPINNTDTYTLLFVTVFSIFMLIITIVQYYVLDPEE